MCSNVREQSASLDRVGGFKRFRFKARPISLTTDMVPYGRSAIVLQRLVRP